MVRRMVVRPRGRMLVLLAATLCGACRIPAQSAPAAPAFQEQLIGELPAGIAFKAWAVAGGHVAWAGAQDGKWIVQLDGHPQGGSYDGVQFLTLTPDGLHLHFFGKRHDKWIHVLDGVEAVQEYAGVTPVALRPGSNSFAFGACVEKKSCYLVVDDKVASSEYQAITPPRYSADGQHLGFTATFQKQSRLVVDGREVSAQVGFFDPAHWGFDANGRLYAAVSTNFKWTYLIGDRMGPMFDVISPIVFSPDGRHCAWAAANVHPAFHKQKVDAAVIVDGQTGPSFEGSGLVGVWASVMGQVVIAPFGVQEMHPDFYGVSNPVFSPAGQISFAVRRSKGQVSVLLGNDSGPALDELLTPIVFSPDGRHLAYAGARDNAFLGVLDSHPGPAFPVDARVGAADWAALSPDGSRFAWEEVRGGVDYFNQATTRARRTVVVDGHPGKEYNAGSIGTPLFTPDGHHLVYAVSGVDGKYALAVADGAESQPYDEIAGLSLTPNGSGATFIARSGPRLVRVTCPLP